MVHRELMQCHAKVNLYLKVVGRRSDGFHELETVFQGIDIADTLSWHPGEAWHFSVDGGPDYGDSELIRRAARKYAEKAQVQLGGHAHLQKRIPVGAGLGGGSSDAAGMLKLLNQHHQKLSEKQLQAIALDLGSDVPFFLKMGCQWGRGRGERLTSCTWNLPHRRGFLLLPSFGIATAEVFNLLNAPNLDDPPKPEVPDVIELGRNDLFATACLVAPALATLWREARDIIAPDPFFMSGSGSTLVWLTDSESPPPELIELLVEKKVSLCPFTFK